MGGQQKNQKNINYTLIKNNFFKKSKEILEGNVLQDRKNTRVMKNKGKIRIRRDTT